MQPRILLELSHSTDCARWEALYVAGQVPDRWPYGLDRLAAYGLTPVAPEQPRTGWRRQINGVVRRVGRFQWGEEARSLPDEIALRLAWSELGGIPASMRRTPPVVSGVIWLTEKGAKATPAARLAASRLRKMQAVFVLSDAQIPVLVGDFGVPRERVHHLSFGVDADYFSMTEGAEAELVVSVGNDRHRDHAALLRSMAEVRRTHQDARLTIVTRQQLGAMSKHDVHIPELTHAKLRELYSKCAVVAVATSPNVHASGLTATLEGMASGKPVVVSNNPGMSHYVKDGVSGLLVPPGDDYAFAHAVGTLLNDPDRAQEMGVQGREAVERLFNTERQAEAVGQIVHGVLEQ